MPIISQLKKTYSVLESSSTSSFFTGAPTLHLDLWALSLEAVCLDGRTNPLSTSEVVARGRRHWQLEQVFSLRVDLKITARETFLLYTYSLP